MPLGFQGHLGIRKEAAFASGGTIDSWQPFNSETIEQTINNVYSDRVQSTSEQVGGHRGNEVVAGGITFPVSPSNPTQWWTCGLGQATSPFYVARPLSSLLLQIDRETAAVQVSGAMINNITFSSASNGELTCSVDIEAAGMGSCTAGSPTFTASDEPYLHEESVFQLNGIADTSITSWSIAINNNLQTDLFGNQLKRIDIPAGKLLVTGTFSKLFDDTTERNAFLSAGVRSFKAAFSRGAKSLVFLASKIRYNSHPENIGGQSEYIIESFNWTAFIDDQTTEYSVRISGS